MFSKFVFELNIKICLNQASFSPSMDSRSIQIPGIVDTPENLWSFYISRVRKNLHMSLCFSPVGDGLWSRARRFPALVNCTTIDWQLGDGHGMPRKLGGLVLERCPWCPLEDSCWWI